MKHKTSRNSIFFITFAAKFRTKDTTMNTFLKKTIITCAAGLFTMTASAQLSTNPDKFLGNITTRGQVEAGGGVASYYKLWNQITCENESKWQSVEGTRGSFNWGCDRAFNYAQQHNFTYKFHAFVWGAQYPNWLSSLSIKDRYDAIVTWFDAISNKYSHLPMIDVVNEAVGNHQAGNSMMRESLGGEGKTGYDWLVRAFEMAFERFPNSILIYNDYNSFQHDVDNYLKLVQTLRDAGAPIDAYGNQSHDVNNISANNLKTVMKKQQDALKMPMYITELDIDIADDNQQKKQYESIFPLMWEADYCAGVTIWGYIHGATWVDNSGIIKGGKDRPAMSWLREYMQSDAAKNAKSPFPGMKKRMSVFVNPLELKVVKDDVLPIKVRTFITNDYKAEKEDIAIDKVELYVDNDLLATMTEEPYVTEYTPNTTGKKELKAIVYTNDGKTYERYSVVTVLNSTARRTPFNGTATALPGTIMANEYDNGASGVAYNKATRTGATQTGGWMEYTVDVKEDGLYSFDAEIASTVNGATYHMSEYSLDGLMFLTDMIEVPKTGSNTDFQTMHYALKKPLTAGVHRLCLNIDKGGFYIKSLTFHKDSQDENISVSFSEDTPVAILGGEKATITIDASSKTSTIANVKVYANNLLIATLTEAPYTVEYEPAEQGRYEIIAIATDVDGKSSTASYTLNVNPKREPFAGGKPINIPGTLQAEYYDKGGEGAAYHDGEAENRGDANYRTNDGVDIVNGNNGKVIGYTNTGEWVEYTINVKETGTYKYVATVSSGTTGSGFSINIRNGNTVTKLADVKVPQTGNNDWGTYKTVEGTVELEAGEQILRLTITGSNCNIDKIQFSLVTGINGVTIDEPSSNDALYNLSGQKVNANYKGIIIQNGKKRLNK
jgi:GH35 family endo-1,4-beta-xylanase